VPKDDADVLHSDGDVGLHGGFHDHVTRQNHEQAARSDESSCDNDDVDSDVDLDVIDSDVAS